MKRKHTKYTFILVFYAFTSIALANYVGAPPISLQVNPYVNQNVATPSSAVKSITQNTNPLNVFSIDVTDNDPKVSISWKVIDEIIKNESQSESYFTPILIKKEIMSQIFDQTETFYLPEPITVVFLVIGMFVLFGRRKHPAV